MVVCVKCLSADKPWDVVCVCCDTPELWLWRGAASLCARVRARAGAAKSLPLHTYIHTYVHSNETAAQSQTQTV